MRILKIHKRIEVDKSIGNMRITSLHYSRPIENSSKWENYTEISCWYDNDCENCPMGWETRSYEGECDDCGCLFDYDFRVPIWKCMLPRWIKNIIAKSALRRFEDA
jgi:hypothetical protein